MTDNEFSNDELPKALQHDEYTKKGQKNEGKHNKKKTKKKKNKAFKVIKIILIVLIILILLVVGGVYGFIKGKLNKLQQVDLSDDLSISDEAEENLTGYRNIALFGVDSRDSELGEGNRSDCIIIASINNDTGEIKLLSVYRDTYVQIEGYGLDKITHAYSYGSAELALKTLNTNLDLNITEFVTVNFDVLAEAINELGGVTITIEEDELEYINSYIDSTSSNTGISSSHITSAGTQTLDGIQAVAYSRIRYTTGGDYKRTERMRDVVIAMIDKVKEKSLTEINSLVDDILPQVYTNISSSTIISLLPNLLTYEVTDSIGWPYEVKGITLDRWYGVPVTLESNVSQMYEELFGIENYTPTSTVQEISDAIISKTGYE